MGCEHALISLFSRFFLGCFMDFDRYQVCTEGVLLCPTGWTRYRACSESEILSQYAGQIHMIRRMVHCNDQDFNILCLASDQGHDPLLHGFTCIRISP